MNSIFPQFSLPPNVNLCDDPRTSKRSIPIPPQQRYSLRTTHHLEHPSTQITTRASTHFPVKNKLSSDLSLNHDNGLLSSDFTSSVNSILSDLAHQEQEETNRIIDQINRLFYKVPSATSAETDCIRYEFIENGLKELYQITSLVVIKKDSKDNYFISKDPAESGLKSLLRKLSFDYHQSEYIRYDAEQSALLIKCYHREYFENFKPFTTEEREAHYLPPPPEEWLEEIRQREAIV